MKKIEIDTTYLLGDTIKDQAQMFLNLLRDQDLPQAARQSAEEYLKALEAGVNKELTQIEAALATLPGSYFTPSMHDQRVVLIELLVLFV